MPPFEDDTVSFFSSCDTIDTFGTEDLASLGEEEIVVPQDYYDQSTVDGDDVNDYSGMAITVDDTTLTNDYDYQDYQEDFDDHDEEEEEHPTCSTVASSSSTSSHPRRRRPSSRIFFREGVNTLTDVSPQRPRRSLSLSRPILLPPDSGGIIKSCTFAADEDLVHIFKVPCLVELLATPEECSTIWYSSDEQEDILMECIATVRALRQTISTITTNSHSASEPSGSDLHHRHHPIHPRHSLDLLQSKLVDDHEELTDRGLEFMSSVGFDISRNSRAAVQALLQEQDRLRKELLEAQNESQLEMEEAVGETTTSTLSPSDPERLSHVCRRTSAHRQRIAHLMGIRDARAVQEDSYNSNQSNKKNRSNSNSSSGNRMMESHSMHSSTTSSSHASHTSSDKHHSHRKNLQRDGSLRRINPWAQPPHPQAPPSTSSSPSQSQRKSLDHCPQHRLSHPSMTRSLHDSGGRARARQARREQSFSAARLRQSQDTK
jgi:hypothetical protein